MKNSTLRKWTVNHSYIVTEFVTKVKSHSKYFKFKYFVLNIKIKGGKILNSLNNCDRDTHWYIIVICMHANVLNVITVGETYCTCILQALIVAIYKILPTNPRSILCLSFTSWKFSLFLIFPDLFNRMRVLYLQCFYNTALVFLSLTKQTNNQIAYFCFMLHRSRYFYFK